MICSGRRAVRFDLGTQGTSCQLIENNRVEAVLSPPGMPFQPHLREDFGAGSSKGGNTDKVVLR